MPRTRPASTAAPLSRIGLQRRVCVAEAEAAQAPMRAAFARAGFDSQSMLSPVAGPRAEVL